MKTQKNNKMVHPEEILKVNAPSIREAVTQYFMEKITSGVLRPGDVLPSSRDIAEKIGTSSPNVHQGLVPLVKAGLIRRDRKNGTVVTRQERRLSGAVLYIYRENLDDMPQFQRVLIDRLTVRLEKRNISPRLVMDNKSLFGFKQILTWIRNQEIQAVIFPIGGKAAAEIIRKFRKLPVAVVAGSSGLDMDQFVKTAVDQIHKSGCRRPALVTISERFHLTSEGNWRENDFFRIFRSEIRKKGMEYHEELVRGIHDESFYFHGGEQLTSFGFEECNHLLALPEERRPDALLVFPDQLITAVMLSVMKNSIKVPDQLKLFVHRNWEINEPLFLPATMIGISVDEVAGKMIDNLFETFSSQELSSSSIAPTIRINH